MIPLRGPFCVFTKIHRNFMVRFDVIWRGSDLYFRKPKGGQFAWPIFDFDFRLAFTDELSMFFIAGAIALIAKLCPRLAELFCIFFIVGFHLSFKSALGVLHLVDVYRNDARF